ARCRHRRALPVRGRRAGAEQTAVIARTKAGEPIRLRAYQCPAGQGWHLTSRRPPRKRRVARERARRYTQILAHRTQRPAPPETLAAARAAKQTRSHEPSLCNRAL